MTQDPEIRAASASDADAIAGLMEQLGYVVSGEEARRRMTAVAAASGAVLVAAIGREIVGCAQVVIEQRLAEGLYGEIVSLVVDLRRRGEGIGGHLIGAAREWAGSQGASRLRVRCNVKRTEAHAFYAACGFETIKRQTVFELAV
jgi:GNAT superfamily N-acetyltransferase